MTADRRRLRAATAATGAAVAVRHRAVLAVVAGVVLLAGLGLPGLGTNVTVGSFLDADDPAVVATNDRSALFGDDPIVIVLEIPAGEAVVAPALTGLVVLERDLAALPGVARVDGPGTVISAATAGVAGMLGSILGTVDGARLTAADEARREAEAAGLDADEVEAAMVAAIDAADDPHLQRYGPLLAQHLRLGLPELDNPSFTRAIALDDAGAPRPLAELVVPDAAHVAIQVRPTRSDDAAAVADLVDRVRSTVDRSSVGDRGQLITGAPVVSAAVAEDVRGELPWLALLGALAMAGLLWFANRAPRPLAPLLGVGAGLVVGLGTLGWAGVDLGLGAVAVVPIVLGLGTDFGVNVGQWYVHARRGGADAPTAVGEAWARTLPPLGLAALVATAAATVALLSPSPAIRALGVALPVTLLLSLGFSLLVNGALLATAGGEHRATGWDRLRDRMRGRVRTLRLLRRGGARATAAGAIVVGALGWVALPLLAVEADLPALIGDSEEVLDARRAERVLGSAGTVELIVTADDVTDPVVLGWLDQVVGEVVRAEGQQVQALLWPDRLLSWLGPDLDAGAVRRGLEALPPQLTSAVVRPDDGAAVATFGVPWSASSEQARLLGTMRGAIADPPPGATARLAGLPVLVASAYDDVAASPVRDTLVGLGAAAAVLFVALRRRSWLPIGVLLVAGGLRFAVVALSGAALNPITLALVAFVAAVDAEFALVFRAARTLGEEGRRMAVRVTGVSAATAALGFGVLTLSQIAGLRSFGAMAAVAVLAGWAGAVALFSVLPSRSSDQPSPPPVATGGGRRRTVAAVAASALLAGACTAGGDDLEAGVLVEVDGTPITQDDLDDRIEQLRALYQLDAPAAGSDAEAAFRDDLLTSMVAVELLEVGARERDVWVPTADVVDQLESYRSSSYPWDDDFRASLAATGMGEAELTSELRYQLLQARLFDDVTAEVEVTDAEVAEALAADPARFDLPERRSVRQVVVADEAAAQDVRDLLVDGADFAAVAQERSLDQVTAAQGGELGTLTRDQLMEGFADAVFALDVDAISEPIVTELGVHIAQVTAVQPAGPVERDTALAVLRQQLTAERAEARWSAWVAEVEGTLDIRYAPGVGPFDLSLTDVDPSADVTPGLEGTPGLDEAPEREDQG